MRLESVAGYEPEPRIGSALNGSCRAANPPA
jgi:hypothetical protein